MMKISFEQNGLPKDVVDLLGNIIQALFLSEINSEDHDNPVAICSLFNMVLAECKKQDSRYTQILFFELRESRLIHAHVLFADRSAHAVTLHIKIE